MRGVGRPIPRLALVGVIMAFLAGCVAAGTTPPPSAIPTSSATAPASSSQPPSPSPRSTPSPSPLPSPSLGPLGDLQLYSVSELLAARKAGRIGGQRVALRGYWTNRAGGHSCAPPSGNPGALELYCVGGEFGITELDEPIITISANGQVTEPKGPHLTPYLDETTQHDIAVALFALPFIYGQWYPPVPLVAAGHFDDPRAAQCRPEAVQLCRDRLVIDWLVSFDPGAVVLPTPTPTPTPFPVADPPAAPFDAARCSGDVPYSFAGWTTIADLGLDIAPGGWVYAMVTRDILQIGDRIDDPAGSGGRFRTMGQRICYAREDEASVTYASVPGTAYREWADGHRTPLTP